MEDLDSLKISEAAEVLDVQVTVLRHWGNAFKDYLSGARSAGRHRLFPPGDMDVYREIKRYLQVDGLTSRAVKRLLKTAERPAGAEAPAQPVSRPPVKVKAPAPPPYIPTESKAEPRSIPVRVRQVGWWCKKCGELMPMQHHVCDCLMEIRTAQVEAVKARYWSECWCDIKLMAPVGKA